MRKTTDPEVISIMKKARETQKIMNEYTENMILSAFAREEKDKERIKELEDTIRDLLQMLYKVPPVELSWSDVETINEIKKKILNKE